MKVFGLDRLLSATHRVRVVMLACALLLSSCGIVPIENPFNRSSRISEELVAKNLIHSLVQIQHLSPDETALQVSRRPHSRFESTLQSELNLAGYQLEAVKSRTGMNLVRPSVTRLKTSNGKQKLYSLTIGTTTLERAYSVVAGKTVPVSELTVRGAVEQAINLNDDVFEVPDSRFSHVAFGAYDGPQIDDILSPSAPGSKQRKAGDQNAVKHNMYETLTSNYNDVFSGYEDIDQSILVFPNDSLRLGEVNKQILEDYASKMNPKTDVVSVIGCSHGNTEINNGNSLLALGRANRVKEALLFLGLEHNQVLEEGCWAPVLFDEVMPRRGVVLTLKRKNNA